MENIEKIWNNILHTNVVNSIVIVLLGLILYKFVIKILDKGEENDKFNLFTSKKRKTYLKHLKSIVRYVFMILTVLVLLKVNGVDISSVLTGVGIIGVVFGLAIQDWLKDIIRGSSILSDDYFQVGDIVKYNDIEGKVLVIGLKTTKIEALATKNVISIANRNIEKIEVVSNFIYVRIPMPYGIPVERAEKAIEDIMAKVKGYNNVKGCRYLGVTELADSSIQYLLEVNCEPQFKLQVRRDTLKSILLGLADNNIEVPFTQIDIHNK